MQQHQAQFDRLNPKLAHRKLHEQEKTGNIQQSHKESLAKWPSALEKESQARSTRHYLHARTPYYIHDTIKEFYWSIERLLNRESKRGKTQEQLQEIDTLILDALEKFIRVFYDELSTPPHH